MPRSARSVHRRLARTPATITAGVFAGVYVVSALIYLTLGAPSVIGIAAVATIVGPLLAALQYSDSWRPRWPTQQLVERVRSGINPIGVAYATLIASVCPVALFFTWVGFAGDSNFAPSVVVVFALCCLFGALFGPKHVAVDPSGIFVQRFYGWACIPWRAVQSISVYKGARMIVITTRRDGEHRVSIDEDSPLDAALLIENILRFQPQSGSFDPTDPRFAVLDRGGRSREQWITDVHALVTQSSFREAPITIDDLRQLLAHDDTPRDRRIAAAAALAVHDASAPERIRVAIDECDDRSLANELEEVARGASDSRTQRR